MRRARTRLRLATRAWLNDGLADLSDRLAGPVVGRRIPPASLRWGVARGPSRDEYLKAGALASSEILSFLLRAGVDGEGLRRWLDFGCGSGRLSWLLLDAGAAEELTGVDIDRRAVEWCAKHFEPGVFRTSSPMPPLDFESGSFDIVLAASVFTHFDEAEQYAWLRELSRILRPGGYLLASTHGPDAAALRPEIGAAEREALERSGFLHFQGSGAFNDRSAFHSRDYLERNWRATFELVSYEERRLFRFQNLALWRRPEA